MKIVLAVLVIGLAIGLSAQSGEVEQVRCPPIQPSMVCSLFGHAMREGVYSVAFSPDGQWIAAGAGDGNVHLWDILRDNVAWVTRSFRHTDRVYSVAFSPDGTVLAAGAADGTVKLWDMSTGQAIDTKIEQPGAIHSVAFSPDGRRLAVGGAGRTLALWDIKERQEVFSRKLPHTTWAVHSVMFSPDGTRLVTRDDKHWIRIWDVKTGEQLRARPTHVLYTVAFCPTGNLIASGEWGMVRLWDATTLMEMRRLKHPELVLIISAVAFSPDGQLLASGAGAGDGAVRLWVVPTGKLVQTFAGQLGFVSSIAFSPDGRLLVAACHGGPIRLWYIGNLVRE